MKLAQHPELLDRLASSYALGTLRGGARRRFEAMAREQAAVRVAALSWQTRLGGLNELQPPAVPSPAVWTRLDNLVRAGQDDEAMSTMREARSAVANRAGRAESSGNPGGWLRGLSLWRGLSAAGALAAVLALSTALVMRSQMDGEIRQLQARLLAAPQIDYVAVLANDQASPSMLVTFDAGRQALTLQRLGGFREANDKSLQLWALPPAGSPRSLGVLGRDAVLSLPAAERDVQGVPTLAISLEPQGGVPSAGGPTGPVLFTGSLIRKML